MHGLLRRHQDGDVRDSKPAALAEILALADDFVAHGFDTRRTIRLILNSRTYQPSSQPNAFNADDARSFSHANVRLLSAEQSLDAISSATGVPERLFHLPAGTRASQVADGEFGRPFLKRFGQPSRAVACEGERGADSTLEQALQVDGGRTVLAEVAARENRIGRLVRDGADDATLLDELPLCTLGRPPEEPESTLAASRLAAHPDDRSRLAEDLPWSLLNHPESPFQH